MNPGHVFCASSAFLTGSQAVIGHGALPCIRHDTLLYHNMVKHTIPYSTSTGTPVLHGALPAFLVLLQCIIAHHSTTPFHTTPYSASCTTYTGTPLLHGISASYPISHHTLPASPFCLKLNMQSSLHKVCEVKFNLMREGGSQ